VMTLTYKELIRPRVSVQPVVEIHQLFEI